MCAGSRSSCVSSAFESRLPFRVGHRGAGSDGAGGGPEQLHPLADEVAGRQRLRCRMQRRPDAVATPVAEHDDVPDLQALHGELQRGGGAMVGEYQNPWGQP